MLRQKEKFFTHEKKMSSMTFFCVLLKKNRCADDSDSLMIRSFLTHEGSLYYCLSIVHYWECFIDKSPKITSPGWLKIVFFVSWQRRVVCHQKHVDRTSWVNWDWGLICSFFWLVLTCCLWVFYFSAPREIRASTSTKSNGRFIRCLRDRLPLSEWQGQIWSTCHRLHWKVVQFQRNKLG